MNARVASRWHRAGNVTFLIFLCMLEGVLAAASYAVPVTPDASLADVPAYDALARAAHDDGTVRIIVKLHRASAPNVAPSDGVGPRLDEASLIAASQQDLLDSLRGHSLRAVKRFRHVPYLGIQVDASGLEQLRTSPLVERIFPDAFLYPNLPQSVPLVGGNKAWRMGYSGAGQSVAILDTGVDKSHPFLSGKVVAEACYGTTTNLGSARTSTLCQNGLDVMEGAGAGVPCGLYPDCAHGTHVAGIAAGRGATFAGVARDASLISVQVFSMVQGSHGPPVIGAFTSDVMSGLEFVYRMRGAFSIPAVNLSMGDGIAHTTTCDADPLKAPVDLLKSVGTATLAASGNASSAGALESPACISSVVSVGATDKSDSVAWFSNSASFLDLLAPGVSIYSPTAGGGYAELTGTSAAAPHIAGAWAILKSQRAGASVDQLRGLLAATGRPVFDYRSGLTKPRIQVDAALSALASTPYLRLETGSAGFVGGWFLGSNDQHYAGDFDGNGTAELFTRSGNYAGLVGIARGGLTSWAVVGGAIGGWVLSPTDRHYVGDFDGDGHDDLFTRNGVYATVLTYRSDAFVSAAGAAGAIGGWMLSPEDRHYVGDFDGDGIGEVFTQNGPYAVLLRFRNGQLTTDTGAAGQIGGWWMSADDQHYVGDFDGDGRDEIFVQNGAYAGILRYEAGIFRSAAIVRGSIGGWQLGPVDRYYVADLDGDGRDEVFVRSPAYAAVLRLSAGQLTSQSVVGGAIGGWRLSAADRHYPGDFDGDGSDEIFTQNASYASVIRYSGGVFSTVTTSVGAVDGWKLSSGDRYFTADLEGDGSTEVFCRSAGFAGVFSLDLLQ